MHETPQRAGWDWCHVLFVDRVLYSLVFLAVFCVNRKSYFSLLTSKRKSGRDTRNCVRVKYIKSKKWRTTGRRERVGEILGPDISPVLLEGCIYFVHDVHMSFAVIKTFFIALSTCSYSYLQSQFDILFSFFYLRSFLLESRLVIITFFCPTLGIYMLIIISIIIIIRRK